MALSSGEFIKGEVIVNTNGCKVFKPLMPSMTSPSNEGYGEGVFMGGCLVSLKWEQERNN